ncbi:hypothetical protein BpHYR1_036029 [Brachionus plicatilis]|uniref:Uncharacterized protein n=1 Tax=Brachionus plicatilis TaxID=10195 RepID=A0A3M7S8I1_BRAPC|nr:hypothetical protein BpHYR1_036029 [Brachionus plicatilis]
MHNYKQICLIHKKCILIQTPFFVDSQLSLSFLYLEKTTEHDFSTDIFIFHLHSQLNLKKN